MIFAIDANGFVARYYHALGGGRFTGSAGMLLTLIRYFLDKHPDAKVVSAFDGRNCFRKEVYPDYKAKRKEPDDDYREEIKVAYEIVKDNGYPAIKIDGFEADDIIASIVAGTEDKVVIVSSDKDFNQLLQSGRVTIIKKAYRDMTGWQFEYMNEAKFSEEFGITPTQWIEYQCLAGDSVDGWPGAKGVGPKTALAYLKGEAIKPAKLSAIKMLDMDLARRVCELRKDVVVNI